MHESSPSASGQEIAHCVRAARPRLKALFRAHRCSPEDAEDILQEALMVVAFQWSKIAEPEPFLLAVVRLQILRLLRLRRRQREVSVDPSALDRLPSGDSPHARADCRRDLQFLLSCLPGRGGRIVALRYIQGLSSSEIAAEMDYSENSVRKLAARHLDRLRRHAQEIGFER